MKITKIFRSLLLWQITALLVLTGVVLLFKNHSFFAAWSEASLQILIIMAVHCINITVEALHHRFIQAGSLKDTLKSLALFHLVGILAGLTAYCLYEYPQVLSDLRHNRPAFDGLALIYLAGGMFIGSFTHSRLYETN